MGTGNVFRIVKTKKVEKYIRRQDKHFKERIEEVFETIAKNPFEHPNIVKMRGLKEHYRYTMGDYRIIYRVFKNIVTVQIIKVGPRGDVYK